MGTKHGHSMTCAHLLCSQLVSSHLMCLSSSQLSWRRLTGLPRPLPESDDKFCFLSSLRLTLGQQINTCGDILCRQIKNSDLSIFLHTYSHNCLDSILKRTLAAFFSFCCFVYPSTCSKSWFQELCILQRRMSFETSSRHFKELFMRLKILQLPSLWTWCISSSVTLYARPKSITLKTPSWLDQSTLAGFRSAWTMPWKHSMLELDNFQRSIILFISTWPWRLYKATRRSWANRRQAQGERPRLSFL